MKRTIFSLFILIIVSVMPVGAATSRALVFGIGKYEDKYWGKIHGDNDISYVCKFLGKAGFTDVTVLKNEQATKQGMVNAFEALKRRCQKGDVVYIHYSGHGQLMTDVDGDESLRTSARHAQWDESWVPYDGYMNYCAKDKGEKHFCDDEVEVHLSAIRKKIGDKGKLMVVIDACHSGDSSCGAEEEYVRGVDTKFIIPKATGRKAKPKHKKEQWLTVSACKPYQLSAEMKNVNVGKLTYALSAIGKDIFTLSPEELQKRLSAFMEKNKGRMSQDPVVSGKR